MVNICFDLIRKQNFEIWTKWMDTNKMPSQELQKSGIKKLKWRKTYWKVERWYLSCTFSWHRIVFFCQLGCYVFIDFLSVINVYSKYVWVKPFIDKKLKSVFYGLIEIIDERNRKAKKDGLINEKNYKIDIWRNR